MTAGKSNIVELSASEIEEVDGGAWLVVVAIATLALAAYAQGVEDGKCYG